MIKFIKSLYKKVNETDEEKYLAESISLADIERRQRLISRGEAPFQKYSKHWTEGAY